MGPIKSAVGGGPERAMSEQAVAEAANPFEGTDHFVPPRFRVEDLGAVRRISAEIRALAKKKNAIILAHNYQLPEVQEVADFVGDSLGLARQVASSIRRAAW